MKNRLVLSFIAIFISACASTPTTPPESTDEPIAAQSATLIVQGMSCPLCATNVDKQLMAIRGVSKATVDLGSGAVLVEFSNLTEHPTRAQLQQAIVDSGYTLTEIKAN